PLLNFDLIRDIVEYNSGIPDPPLYKYSLITNGTLLDKNKIKFFTKHNFSIQLSVPLQGESPQFDNKYLESSLNNLKILSENDDITFSTNSVFTPSNIDKLTDHIEYLADFELSEIGISFDHSQTWDGLILNELSSQINRLTEREMKKFQKSRRSNINLFKKDKFHNKIKGCGAGNGQISVTPRGDIWGCDLFYYYFKNGTSNGDKGKYLFGNINDPDFNLSEHLDREIVENYHEFRGDMYKTLDLPCFLCPYLKECHICPAILYRTEENNSMFFVPKHECEINKILINAKRKFFSGTGGN
ncbi:MAG: hypothetical protein KAR14_03570, partial [Candidatus Aminicenantes bacterium]|nr:hypothetical protein [Candidatus Aminicenantes bacterium]